MALAKPVIATRVVGCQDLVTDETGILVPARDAKALESAILRLFQNPAECKRMGEAGQKHFLNEFTADRFVNRTSEFYKTLSQ